MSRFMVLRFYFDVCAPSAMNIRRGAIATDFHCAIRNHISCIIHTITESMKKNKSATLYSLRAARNAYKKIDLRYTTI